MAMLIEVSFAPYIRANASRWHALSMMAMFIGTLISFDRCSAAARAIRAPSRVSVGIDFVLMMTFDDRAWIV